VRGPVGFVCVCVCGLDEFVEGSEKRLAEGELLDCGVHLVVRGDVAHEVVVDLVHHWHSNC